MATFYSWLNVKPLTIVNSSCRILIANKRKILMRLQLSVFILFFAIMQVCAESFAQVVTLKERNVSLTSVFESIKEQTGYVFVYNSNELKNSTINIEVQNASIEKALEECLRNLPFTFKIVENNILVRKDDARGITKTTAGDVQQREIQGKVVDQDGNALYGVSVRLKGTAAGTSTDNSGNYSISVVGEQSVLVFTYIGFAQQEILVHSNSIINLTLIEERSSLSEVVVVGYGTQRKINLTGAVSTISVKETLQGRPIADVGRAIQGSTPGLSISIPSGEIGSDPRIRIRGQVGSLSGGSSPLILLDNVEIPSIQLVNPSDIESISVLKDAAAASIYGSKAAFGVILITTKQGSREDKINIDYTNNFSIQRLWKDLEMGGVSALQYALEAAERTGGNRTGAYYRVNRNSLPQAYEWWDTYGGKLNSNDPVVYGRDWYYDPATGYKFGLRIYDPYDYLIKEWPLTHQHNLTVGGTSGRTSYNIGLGLLNQSGMMKEVKADNFKRYNASVRLNSEINDNLTVRVGTIYSQREKQYPYVTSSTSTDPWYYIYRFNPVHVMGRDENGDMIRSPVSEMAQANTASMLYDYLNLNLGTTVKVARGLTANVDYTYARQEYLWNRPGTRFTARDYRSTPVIRYDDNGEIIYVNTQGERVPSDDPNGMISYELPLETYTSETGEPNHLYRESQNTYRSTVNAYATYEPFLNEDNVFKFIGGMNMVKDNGASQYTRVTNLIDIINPQFNYGIGAQTGGGDASWESQLGYFGRMNYAFKNKYLFEANLRYDGSSKFPTHLQWRWFPSFSAGWNLTEESFMDWSDEFLSSFKLRGSWGTIGDQTISNSLYIPTMSTGQTQWIGGNGSLQNHVGTPSAVSSSITWQDITTLNFGIDTRLFNDKLGISVDRYRRDTENMIVPGASVAATYGASAPRGNFGSLRTTGWELALDFNHQFNNGLGINVRANISDAKSVITSYGDTKSVDNWYVGKTYGEIWGYRTDRLYQFDDFELDGNGDLQLITLTENESKLYAGRRAYKLKPVNGEKPVYQVFAQNSSNFLFGPGDVKFVDLNGDGEFNDGSRLIANDAGNPDYGDLEIIGNSTPKYEYGLRLGADYKGFDFSMFLQGVGKREIWGTGFLAQAGFHTSDGAMPASISNNYWTPERPYAFYPSAYTNGGSNSINNMQVQSRYLLDMSYLRIKNLSFGYSLPKIITDRLKLNNTRVYISLENFITFDKLGGLPIDPEEISGNSMFHSSNYNLSRTGTGTPTFKNISAGIQLNF